MSIIYTETKTKCSNALFEREARILSLDDDTTIDITNATFSMRRDSDGTLIVSDAVASVTAKTTHESRVNYRLDTAALDTGNYSCKYQFNVNTNDLKIVKFNLVVVNDI